MEVAVNSTAEDLPREILENIFSYCSHEDLVQSVQNVCSRWREVAQSTSLWKNVTYSAEGRSEHVVEFLKMSPKLQNIILKYKYDDRVLQAITDNCAELRMLEVAYVDLETNFIKNLLKKCPEVRHLRIPYRVLTDLEKCEVVAKFSNLKVLLLYGSDDEQLTINTIKLRPIAGNCKQLEHLEFQSPHFEINDLHHLLSMRKDTLRTLSVPCCNRSGECVLPVVSTSELQSLSLSSYGSCHKAYEKVEGFGRLKTVRALKIYDIYPVETDHLKQIFENRNMAQLEKLTLDDSHSFDDVVTGVIVRNCPLLKYISLRGCQEMTDVSLKLMPHLKELISLSISYNKHVTDNGILHLQDVQSLKSLRIEWCQNLTKVGLGNIAKLSTLRDLSLEMQDLTEFPWVLIPLHMKYLRNLSVYHCRNVDLFALKKLNAELPCLKVKGLDSIFNDVQCSESGFCC